MRYIFPEKKWNMSFSQTPYGYSNSNKVPFFIPNTHLAHINHALNTLKNPKPDSGATLNTKRHRFPQHKWENHPLFPQLVSGSRACRKNFCRSVNCRNDDIHCRRHKRNTPILNPDTISQGTIPETQWESRLKGPRTVITGPIFPAK